MSIRVKGYKNAIKLREIQKDLIEYEDLYASMEDLRQIFKILAYRVLSGNYQLTEEDLTYRDFLDYIEKV